MWEKASTAPLLEMIVRFEDVLFPILTLYVSIFGVAKILLSEEMSPN